MHAGQATLVPVRGGWHGGWCWRRVAERLRAAGHRVFTPTLTGLGGREHLLTAEVGIDTDVRDLKAVLRFNRLDGVVLVGHSCGGMVMTQVADRTPERIRALVYVDAMLGAVIHPAADDGNPDVPLSWGECELAMVSSLFTHEPVAADVVVAQDATFLWLPVTALEGSLLRSRDLLVLLMTYQSRRLREVQLREQVWLERNVHHRLCPRLARISFGLPENDDGHMVLDATCEALAARCGVSRPRMPKEPKPLEEVGRVKLGRGSVEIVDRAWFDQACW